MKSFQVEEEEEEEKFLKEGQQEILVNWKSTLARF